MNTTPAQIAYLNRTEDYTLILGMNSAGGMTDITLMLPLLSYAAGSDLLQTKLKAFDDPKPKKNKPKHRQPFWTNNWRK